MTEPQKKAPMRIVTWNCRRGAFEDKVAAASVLQPDILLLQECSAPKAPACSTVWIGPPGKLGVAIVAQDPFEIEPLPAIAGVPDFLVPVKVSGPVDFLLLAAWTISTHRYIRGLVQGMKACSEIIQPDQTVVAGDFNSNRKWDKEHPKELNHSAFVAHMDGIGMASAYHAFHGEPHGSETRPTFFHHGHEEKPHHIDYCFLPNAWMHRVEAVDVGQFADWRQWSDHAPVIVTVTPAGSST